VHSGFLGCGAASWSKWFFTFRRNVKNHKFFVCAPWEDYLSWYDPCGSWVVSSYRNLRLVRD
jgi:hypothetical protein